MSQIKLCPVPCLLLLCLSVQSVLPTGIAANRLLLFWLPRGADICSMGVLTKPWRGSNLVWLACILLAVFWVWESQWHAFARTKSNPEMAAEDLGSVCKNCTCRTGSYLKSKDFSVKSLESIKESVHGRPLDKADATALGRTLYHRIILDNLLEPVFTPSDVVVKLFQGALSCPDRMFSYNLEGMNASTPTLYMFTRSGMGGRIGPIRGKYFDRHAEAVHEYQSLVEEHGHRDGTPADQRQLIWLIIDDDNKLDDDLRERLQSSGINHLYLAHGPTRHMGGAQWNMAWKCIEVLRQVFGDGPVVSVDDDSRVLPELYYRLWALKALMIWPMGNLRTTTGWWEGPEYVDGKMVQWHAGWAADRVFACDMGSFAVNSSSIGKHLQGPQYIPADIHGPESLFLEQIGKSHDDIEPICNNTIEENCHFAWHNYYFPEDQLKDDYNPTGENHP